MEKFLNIVSFNIPFPANYGGVIDVFFKLKALHQCGVKIILHTFEYGREHTGELNKYCKEVHYYKRNTGIISQLTHLPYIVKSRKNNNLLLNLQKNDYPIFFEGLHTCYYLDNPQLKNRLKLVRAHNIEHQYYLGLSQSSTSWSHRLYMCVESFRLKSFERKLKFADYILPLSSSEAEYFQLQYGKEKCVLVPLFHNHDRVGISPKSNNYVLYHGDLSTYENNKAAQFLIEEVALKDKGIHWIIAGRNPEKSFYISALKASNVDIEINPDDSELRNLIQEASINILYTNQTSGVKLKLLNALFNGHFCLANKKMVQGSGLESLCIPASDNPEELIEQLRFFLHKPFPEVEIEKRKNLLTQMYDNEKNAKKIVDLLTQ